MFASNDWCIFVAVLSMGINDEMWQHLSMVVHRKLEFNWWASHRYNNRNSLYRTINQYSNFLNESSPSQAKPNQTITLFYFVNWPSGVDCNSWFVSGFKCMLLRLFDQTHIVVQLNSCCSCRTNTGEQKIFTHFSLENLIMYVMTSVH